MKLLFISLLLNIILYGNFIEKDNFPNRLKLISRIHISSEKYDISTIDISHLLFDNTIICASSEKKTIFCIDLISGIIKNYIQLNDKIKRIEDIAFDGNKFFYVLDGIDDYLIKVDLKGNIVNTVKVKDCQRMLVLNNKIILYKTFFHPNIKWTEPVVFVYDIKGNINNSWGQKPEKPTVGLLPIAIGSIHTEGKNIILSHGSSYQIIKYDLNGNVIRKYFKKPKFYKELIELKGLNDKEIQKWYNTTLLEQSYILKNGLIVSYYQKVDRTKAWLFFQNESNSMELSLPNNIYPIGVLNNKIYFTSCNDENTSDNKTITIDCYEINYNIFK